MTVDAESFDKCLDASESPHSDVDILNGPCANDKGSASGIKLGVRHYYIVAGADVTAAEETLVELGYRPRHAFEATNNLIDRGYEKLGVSGTLGRSCFSGQVCCLAFTSFLVDCQKVCTAPINIAVRFELDQIAHSSSEKKSFSSYQPFSRSETEVKGSCVLRSKARCLRSP
jgi:hypothetical protein